MSAALEVSAPVVLVQITDNHAPRRSRMDNLVITHVDGDMTDAVASGTRSEKDQIAGAQVATADRLTKLSDFARGAR